MNRTRWLLLGGLAVVGLLLLGRRWASRAAAPAAVATERRWPPLDRHVEVEVLNAGGLSGAARDASLRLRRGGLDVVYWGNARESDRDTLPRRPRILVRRGDTGGVGRVVEVLGAAEIVVEPDSAPLVDLTVLIWRDPPR